MQGLSTRPYLMRAIYDWCRDCGLTPHMLVRVDAQTQVPSEYVRDGQIVLNISESACRNLVMDNQAVSFSARFGGVPRDIWVPVSHVMGVFAQESGQGLMFGEDGSEPPDDHHPQSGPSGS
ncbi:MAG: ClpXP protease specificity-enhancing factor, partial [Proteobacteria bacterium]|nr:ClpXP protease specificity-enhancing factor [Pseudomonadota bacterium]